MDNGARYFLCDSMEKGTENLFCLRRIVFFDSCSESNTPLLFESGYGDFLSMIQPLSDM